MTRTRTATIITLLSTVFLTAPVEAGWLHQTNSIFLTDKKQRQPPTLEQMIVNPFDSDDNSICVFLAHTTKRKNKGRFNTTVRIEDADGNLEREFQLAARVRDNSARDCEGSVDLTAGSVVYFQHKIRGPRLRVVNGNPQGMGVTGVISTDGQPSIGAGPLALEPPEGQVPRGYVPDVESGWFHSSNSIFHSQDRNRELPDSISQAMEIDQSLESNPYVCAAFNTDGVSEDRGRVETTVTISYTNGDVETLELSGDVDDHVLANCEQISNKLEEGVLVAFEHTLSDMPSFDQGTYADLVGAVTTTGLPRFRDGSEPDPDPAPGDVFSTADEHAITRLFSEPGNLLKRRKNDQPGKWVIATPSSNPDDFDTQGVGSTPAAALEDYERKMGSLGGTARLLNPPERRKLEWYASMDTSEGSTSVGTDHNRKFEVNLYRPSLGVLSGGPFNKLKRAIRWLQNTLDGTGSDDDSDGGPPVGSILSVADEHAITRLYSQRGNQLKRRKNDEPGKYVITTRNTTPDDFSTQGVGSTPSRALDDYERKMGNLGGSARRLTDSERRKMEWYDGMDSSRGPTSVRTDGNRKFKVDVYRRHLGVVIGGPFNTIEQAISWLQDLVGE